jgi:hypothetical protein
VSGAASGTLGDQLFVARVAHAVVQLAAAIPRDTPPAAAREVARLALADLFAKAAPAAARAPEADVALVQDEALLEVTVRPRGFLGVGLAEVTLRARLG